MTHVAYNVRYMSLVRRLCPNLAKAIELEKKMVQEMCKSGALWTEYLESSEAHKYVKFGESLTTKFPRPKERYACFLLRLTWCCQCFFCG